MMKTNAIQTMFASIAKRYDLANQILSCGIQRYWKQQVIQKSPLSQNCSILDAATGTGDLAFLYEKALHQRKLSGQITAVDFCEPMLEIARKKAIQRHSSIQFQWMDLEDLQFSPKSFDLISIAFGIRNVQHPSSVLQALSRLLKPQGRILILEFGQPFSWIKYPFQSYSKIILPRLGGWLSGNYSAYRYLQDSSAKFPCGPAFAQMIQAIPHCSLSHTQVFMGGIAYLYVVEVCH